jgi:hypothetical protein
MRERLMAQRLFSQVVHADSNTAQPPSSASHAFSPPPMLASWHTRLASFELPAGVDELQPTEERFMYLLRRSLSRKPENKLTDRERKVCADARTPADRDDSRARPNLMSHICCLVWPRASAVWERRTGECALCACERTGRALFCLRAASRPFASIPSSTRAPHLGTLHAPRTPLPPPDAAR